MFSGEALLRAVIYLIVVGVIFWLITYLIKKLPIPDPFATVINVILVVAAVLICINVLLGLAGTPIVRWP